MISSDFSRHRSPEPLETGLFHSRACTVCTLLKGSVAGASAKFVVYPLDRLKMIYQVKGTKLGNFRLHRVFDEIQTILRNEGLQALWKGHLASFVRTFAHSGIVFCSFDFYQERLLDSFPAQKQSVCNILAGGCAGVTSTVITYPLDVWNTRMAISKNVKDYSQVTLVSYEGKRSLYRGLLTTGIGIFPYAGCSFFTFEYLKSLIQKRNNTEKLSSFQALMCGGLAGVTSQTLTYPLDTVRKFLQANTFLYKMKEEGYGSKSHPTIKEAMSRIFRDSGLRGFYNGVSLNWIKGFFGAGISFMIHENIKSLLKKHC
ncbi:mitochondrial carrier superfamily protein [Cardiosporidium cionae]|uniref:Mitochondrial carrier superfamily protein n=1 Tax=Cardiosporidium cionae TaxID=476202 RepID=A0ABQ7J828_9APIC|nr:mitochondrial carrier superfamily protein [Cardiosporidium cionae]|eukprot:KAF8820149.1 mitochondrial carrier superfamily protein [Cardiosporidium cionae]